MSIGEIISVVNSVLSSKKGHGYEIMLKAKSYFTADKDDGF
jgi:hypothetical protein